MHTPFLQGEEYALVKFMKIVDIRTKKATKLHVKECEFCKIKYGTYRNKRKYCSKECSIKSVAIKIRSGEYRKCNHCQEDFWCMKSEDRRGSIRKYCSQKCMFPNKKLNLPLGQYYSYDGYIVISTTDDGRKQIKLHRYLMEKHIGRKLNSEEIIHHINEDKLDNRIENLQIVTRSEHNRIHKFLLKK